MSRAFLVILIVSAGFAQDPADLFRKAPPDVEEQLRSRISKFFQAHVDGKFRLAEQYVADDTKDFYYNSKKSQYLNFEISKIDYSDDFTKATAIVSCDVFVPYPGFGGKPVKFPIPSFWKVVDGVWYWYIDQKTLGDTPFGQMRTADTVPTGNSSPPAFGTGPSVKALSTQVKSDKGRVVLKKDGSNAEQVHVSNKMPGTISLSLDSKLPAGLEMKMDRTELKAGEEATVSLRVVSKQKLPKTTLLQVRVEQTNQLIPLEVVFE